MPSARQAIACSVDRYALPLSVISRSAVMPVRRAGGLATEERVTGSRDAPEFLDVDVDQLARSGALVALDRLQAEAAELAHPDPGQDPRDRRQRHRQRFGDLWAGEAQPTQRGDRLDAPFAGAVGDRRRR